MSAERRRLLAVKQTAAELGVSASMVRKLLRPGGPLIPIRIGRRVLVEAADVHALIDRQRRASAGADVVALGAVR